MTTNGLQMPQSSRKKCSRPSFDILKYQSYHTAESKMLYIFHVDTGTTYTFDIQLAVQESLAELRDAIERRCGIKPSDQVLLMNGGDTLGPQSRICSFSAGTDTNPIYLFSKFSILNQVPPTMLTNTTKGMSMEKFCQTWRKYFTGKSAKEHADPGVSKKETNAGHTLTKHFHGWLVPEWYVDGWIKYFLSWQSPIDTRPEDPNEKLIDQLKASKTMEATFKTLVARADLAQKCYEIAREQASTCHRLVHDQHFQHQGWSAVIANLEDIIQPFQNYASYQFDKFAVYLSDRHYFVEMMNRFYKDLGILAKIPVLPILLEGRESTFCAKVTPSPDPQIQEIAECAREDGIFTWLTTQDNPTTLEAVADHCTRGLQGLNDQAVKVLMNEVNELIEIAKKEEMREIKGLGDRLSTLETLIGRTKVLVQSQGDLAQGFLQNQTRAINLGDPSVLPVICLSHQSQIENMVRNYEQLRDIRERCTAAKEELSFNIYHRLKWVLFVQNRVKDLETQLDMLGGNLQRLMRNLDLLEQVHIGPDMYMEAIGEVVRRRTFSQAFIAWTTELARQLFKVHSDEIARRRDFHRKFDGHFLSPLFPGLQDIPPPFATQPPPIFDNGLPQLTVHHLEFLKEQLPELANIIPEPDMDGIKRFFCLKRLTRGIIDSPKRTNNIPMTVDTQSKEERDDTTTTTTTTTTIVANRVGFESETDTEEFEKIGQGGGDSKVVVVGSSFDEAKQNAVQKQLEENLGNTRSEVEHLRGTLRKMKITTSATIAHFREELKYLREQVTENKPDLTAVSGAVEHALKLYEHHYRLFNGRERELIEAYKRQRASNDTLLASRDQEISNLYQAVQEAETQLADRDLLINTMRQQLNNENAEMRSLQTRFQQQLDDALEQARLDKESAINEINQARQMETEALNASLAQCQSHISELEESLKKAAAEQQRAVKEATDKVQMEYKSELDTIRTRFKMVAMATSTMERSPSDSSLEKIEVEKLEEEKQRLENKMLAERLILKQRENQIQELEAERNGLRHELNESRLKMSKSSSSSSPGLEDTLQTLLSGDKDDIKVSETKKVRLSDDSTMNPEKLARRLEMMALDNKRLMTELYIIRASKGSADTRVEALEADKLRLEIELCKERSRRGGGSRLVADSEVYGSVGELASTSTYASADSTPKDMNLSVAIVPESSSQDISASCSESNVSRFGYDMSRMIPHYRNLVTKHFQHIIEQRPVTWSSCKPGETILVAWEASRSRHIIVQDTKTIHVLNPDGIANELGLNPDGTPKATLIISTVLDKQYCQAKKQENRYHVDQGVKFYRVRVKPIASVP